MGKKKQSPEDKLNNMVAELRHEFSHWIKIVNEGSTDPFYLDGCGIDLVRNHIIYYKREIRALCEASGMPEPMEIKWSTPPEFPYSYMASAKGKRAEKLIEENKKHGRATIVFKEGFNYEVPLDFQENHCWAWNHRKFHFLPLFNTYKGEGVIFW